MKFPESAPKRKEGSQAGLFVKLGDGDRIKGIFTGDPKVFNCHYQGRTVICRGHEKCEWCQKGDKPKFKARFNFLTVENGTWVAKVFEVNYSTFMDLKEMHENEYNLPETCVIVSRHGEKSDTRYRVTPAKDNGGLKPEHFKKLAAIPLNDLSPEKKDEQPAMAEVSDANEDWDKLPI